VSTVATVHTIAGELLAKCELALGTTVGGVPPFVSLNPGLPALDRQCDQLYVWESAPVVESAGGVGSLHFGWKTFIGLNALIARCVPVGETIDKRYRGPSAIKSTAAAQKVMEDMWALWNGVTSEILSGDLFEDFPCSGVRFESMIPLDPQGGFAGWTLALQVELDGYRVEL
jgi:hypothetical protein